LYIAGRLRYAAGMDVTFKTCPKCRHERTPDETADAAICPACGLVFAKWVTHANYVPLKLRRQDDADETAPLTERLVARLLDTTRNVTTTEWWGRALMLALLTIWGWRLAALDFRDGEMMNSFMHAIVLPIHEAGHVLFMPFGEFMTIAGGSLFQLLLPLIAGAVLLTQNRDPFGAALGLWWCGASMIDLAPYIYDAADPQLMLLGGHTGEDGPHDWIYLLDRFGKVARSPVYGSVAHKIGIFIMIAGLVWAAVVLLRQKMRIATEPPELPL
jgi:hypothetical protein